MRASRIKVLVQFSAALLVLWALICTPETKISAQGPLSNEAKLVLTAVDKDLHFVSTLKAEDLQIFEDEKPKKILAFEQITDQPVSLVILIDASASQERTLEGQKLAAAFFVDSIIRPQKDQTAVATFTNTLRVEQGLTNNVTLLRQAIARVKFVRPPGYLGALGGGIVVGPNGSTSPDNLAIATALWDAVLAASSDLLTRSGSQTRRAIILLTDGQDIISKNKISDAVDRTIRDNVAIYSIGIGNEQDYGLNKGGLRKLSERTGGRAFFPKKIGDLQGIFAEIGQELRSQYLITYETTGNVGAAKKIRIDIVNPALRQSGLQLAYRRFSIPAK